MMTADPAAYFAMHPAEAGDASECTWIDTNSEVEPIELVPGLVFRPIVGTDLALNVVHFDPNTEAPVHAHDEEQITYVLEGEFEFEVNGEKRILRPGMSVLIPRNAPHGARTYDTTCLEIDVFHPPRKGLLDVMRVAQDSRSDSGA